MSDMSVGFGSMSTQEINTLATNLVEEATKASKMIEAFSKANDIIRDPDNAKPTLQEAMKATRDFTTEVLRKDLMNQMGKALRIDTVV